jgi:hypothetical protein
MAVHLRKAPEGTEVLLRLGVHDRLGMLALRRREGRLLGVLSAVEGRVAVRRLHPVGGRGAGGGVRVREGDVWADLVGRLNYGQHLRRQWVRAGGDAVSKGRRGVGACVRRTEVRCEGIASTASVTSFERRRVKVGWGWRHWRRRGPEETT